MEVDFPICDLLDYIAYFHYFSNKYLIFCHLPWIMRRTFPLLFCNVISATPPLP